MVDEIINIKFGSLLAPVTLIIISIIAIIVMIINIWALNKCSRAEDLLKTNNNWIIGINVVVIIASIVTLIIGIYGAAKVSGVDKILRNAYLRSRSGGSGGLGGLGSLESEH